MSETDLAPYEVDFPCISGLQCHGGLTYSGECDAPICHVPEPGRSGDIWWLGFDCHHIPYDLGPQHQLTVAEALGKTEEGRVLLESITGNPVYRDMAYVTKEVESLAAQIQAGLYVSY